MDTEKLCRICLQPGATYLIFDETDFEINSIQSKLRECFSEKIEDEQGFPRNICTKCNNTLDQLYQFVTKFHETNKILRNISIVKTEVECEYNNDDDFIWPDEDFIEIKVENSIEIEDEETSFESSKILEKLKPLADLKITKVKNESREEKRRKKTNKVASSILEGNFEWSGQKWCLQKGKTKIQKTNIPTKQKESNKKEIKNISEPKEKEQSKLCPVCGEILKDSKSFGSHMKRFHSNEKSICATCHKEFATKDLLKNHLRKYHGDMSLCSFCAKVFPSRYLMISHVRNVHNKHLKPARKNFTCKLCDKTYKVKKSLMLHERSVHTGYRPAECEVCLKRFTHEDYLKEHMRLHTGEVPFKCPICGRGYAQRCNMKSHLRIHKVSELNETNLQKMKPGYMKRLKKC